MTVSEYVEYCVACASVFCFLRSSEMFPIVKFIQQLAIFRFARIIFSLFAISDHCFNCACRLDQYLVRHSDVVKLGSITDYLFCFSNSIVSIQPHNGLRQQPACTFQNKPASISNLPTEPNLFSNKHSRGTIQQVDLLIRCSCSI